MFSRCIGLDQNLASDGMSSTTFVGGVAELQRAISFAKEGYARNKATFEHLGVRLGHRILDVGCGGGMLVKDLAQAVGSSGSVVAFENSEDQLNFAKAYCEEFTNIEYSLGSAIKMPFPDASFDSISSIQVFEYIKDIDPVLSESFRVLKPGGRAAFLSTVWDHHSILGVDPDVNAKFNQISNAGKAHKNLPVDLPAKMKALGFIGVAQTPVPIWSTDWNEGSFGYLQAQLALFQIKKTDKLTEKEKATWIASLDKAVAEDRFAFVRMAVITYGVKP